VGLRHPVLAGTTVSLTFTFAQAAPVSIDVPVRPQNANDSPGHRCIPTLRPARRSGESLKENPKLKRIERVVGQRQQFRHCRALVGEPANRDAAIPSFVQLVWLCSFC
jgi:hypothetical protein